MSIKKLIIIISIALVIVGGILWLCLNHHLSFEQVAVLDWDKSKSTNSITEELKWFTILDEDYNPWFDESLLTDQYHVDLSDIRFDTEHYSYVLTVNRELKKISYNYLAVGGTPLRYYGKVTLGKETPGKIYIYRIRKMNISIDYKDRDKNIYYE